MFAKADCSQPGCAAEATSSMYISLTPSRVNNGESTQVLIATPLRVCEIHLPRIDFWSFAGEPEWRALCWLMERAGCAPPIRDMVEFIFIPTKVP